ncbi:MerR family DNA-binding transcriptional regulator [Anaeromonas gelatinilytica]|uniref:helix-turn-helix domain-containing protein n=1 Tax=Anaeromonas gelatinilytica TaxID=2683194 RepID=UPI002078A100|nr:MerR family DNA-binding transcriptional regulator [Anaeromonas gelatinilytica]
MSNLIKIKDVSSKYDITARTLRYYEDMGLLYSTRSDDYAYRMYMRTLLGGLNKYLFYAS